MIMPVAKNYGFETLGERRAALQILEKSGEGSTTT
jgi:hypothetical protein